jgi:hypothetical protein
MAYFSQKEFISHFLPRSFAVSETSCAVQIASSLLVLTALLIASWIILVVWSIVMGPFCVACAERASVRRAANPMECACLNAL